MIKDTEYLQDDKTVLLDRQGQRPASGPLTDFAGSPRIEQLAERMIYAAKPQPAVTFNIGLNPLVSAASELLSEVVRLKQAPSGIDLTHLNQHLSEALGRFEPRALKNGIEKSEARHASYLLCTVLDEAVVTATLGDGSWSQMSLLSRFHNETSGGENFFAMLDSLSKNPIKNLSILELMYLCMALGFQGKYRVQPRGMLELEERFDALYRQIRHLRGDVPRELSPHSQTRKDKRRNLVRIVPAWMVVLFTFVCLVVMYSGFAWVLGEQRKTVLLPYQPFDSTPVLSKP